MLLFLLACTSAASDAAGDPALCRCPELSLPASPVTTEADLLALLTAVQSELYPEQAGVPVAVAPVEALQFFRAWVELDTLDEAPADRGYTVHYDPVVLADPPPPAALAAVLAHELAHVGDYLAMDHDELIQFAAWYAGEDAATSQALADYERATDEAALARGCADGLSTMREWIYAHLDAEGAAVKQFEYYTPDQIAAWVAAHGRCAE